MTSQHQVTFYGLSTCIHCRHARDFLKQHQENVDCVYVYVDQLEGNERTDALNQVKLHNPKVSFPTLVIDGGEKVVVGFKPEDLAKALDL